MSRELVRDLDAANVVRGNAGKVTLDAEAFKKFLTAKNIPAPTIDALIPKIQERMNRASNFAGDKVPQRVIDWCKSQITQEMDGLALASDALRGTSIQATTQAAVEATNTPAPRPTAVTDKPAAAPVAPNRIAQNLMGNTSRINAVVDGTK